MRDYHLNAGLFKLPLKGINLLARIRLGRPLTRRFGENLDTFAARFTPASQRLTDAARDRHVRAEQRALVLLICWSRHWFAIESDHHGFVKASGARLPRAASKAVCGVRIASVSEHRNKVKGRVGRRDLRTSSAPTIFIVTEVSII